MVNVKPVIPARPGARMNSSSWFRSLLLAESGGNTGNSPLEAAIACLTRRRLTAGPVVCVSQPKPVAK